MGPVGQRRSWFRRVVGKVLAGIDWREEVIVVEKEALGFVSGEGRPRRRQW